MNLKEILALSAAPAPPASVWWKYHRHACALFKSPEKRASFASSVIMLTRGVTWAPDGQLQGPTVRANACAFALMGPKGEFTFLQTNGRPLLGLLPDGSLPPEGKWYEKEALAWCEKWFSVPIEDHLDFFKTLWIHVDCFNDDPEDIKILERVSGHAANKGHLTSMAAMKALKYNSETGDCH